MCSETTEEQKSPVAKAAGLFLSRVDLFLFLAFESAFFLLFFPRRIALVTQ